MTESKYNPQTGDGPLQEQFANRLKSLLHDAEKQGVAQEVFEAVKAWLATVADSAEDTATIPFLDQARRLDERGQTDTALDIVFDQIDEMLLAGEFDRIDEVLCGLKPTEFSVELLIGLLTVTLPARNRLSNRDTFFQQVRQTLHDRGEAREGLLVGLD